MTDEATPAALRLSAGLGLAFPERDYLAFDPCDGDRDGDVRLRTVKMVRARKELPCFGGADPRYGDMHTIKPGEVYRYERALIDGDYWGQYRMCVACMDKWLTEIGRAPASPNVAANRPASGGSG